MFKKVLSAVLAFALTLAAAPSFYGDIFNATTPTYNVKYYGAKGDAQTTCSAQTTLSATASSGQPTFTVTSPTCIAAGGQIVLDTPTGTLDTLTVSAVVGSTVTATGNLTATHNGPTSTTFNGATSAGATTAVVTSAGSIAVGQVATIDTGSVAEERTVTGVSGTTITFDKSLAWAHSNLATISFATQVTVMGGYISGTDDTAAINSAYSAACAAASSTHPVTVYFPSGKYAISGPLWGGCSYVSTTGAGMYQTTIVAVSGFTFNCNLVGRGNDGQWAGMLDLDLSVAPSGGTCGGTSYPSRPANAPEAPLTNLTVSDIGFDPRAGIQTATYGQFSYQPVVSYLRALQNITFRNVYFDQGATLSTLDLTREWIGISFNSLAYDTSNSSHDLSFYNVVGHNGSGTINLRTESGFQTLFSTGSCPTTLTDTTYNIRVVGQDSTIDQDNIEDDRIVIGPTTVSASSCPSTTGTAQVYGVYVTDAQTAYTANVARSVVNSVHLESSGYASLHHAIINGIRYSGPSSLTNYAGNVGQPYTGTPLSISNIFSAGNGFMRDILATSIVATNSTAILLNSGAEATNRQSIEVTNATLSSIMNNRCISAASVTAPTGEDHITLANLHCSLSATAISEYGTNTQGISWTGSSNDSTWGAQGVFSINNDTFYGFHTTLSLGAKEIGAQVSNVISDANLYTFNGGTPFGVTAPNVSAASGTTKVTGAGAQSTCTAGGYTAKVWGITDIGTAHCSAALDDNANFGVHGNIGTDGQFNGSGAGLTSIPNSALANNSLTVNGTTIALGASGTAPVNSTDDTTTNATYYPLFTTATGGNNSAKTSSTKYTYNPSTGTLASTVFSGSGNSLTSLPINQFAAASFSASNRCIDSASTVAIQALGGDCALVNANNNFSASQSITGNLTASTYVQAGSATASSCPNGDVCASESTTSGRIGIGGSGAVCRLDYGVTTASVGTINCSLTTAGNFTATTYVEGGSASISSCTNGDGCFARSTTTGALSLGGSGSLCRIDYGITTASVFTAGCQFNSSILQGTRVLSQWNSSSNATAPVPPVVTAAGAAQSNTVHFIHTTCSFSAAVSCNVSITGTGNAYSSATSYNCWADEGAGTSQANGFVVGNQTTSSFTVYTTPSTPITQTVPVSCIGT